FCFSEVKLGLIPAVISPYIIKAIGERATRRYFLTAEKFDAEEALRLGLIHKIVAEAELESSANKLAEQLLNNGPEALKEAKCLIATVSDQPLNDAMINETAKRIAKVRVSTEGQEGLKAFFEKRKTNWQ